MKDARPNVTETLNQAHDEIKTSIERLSLFADRVLGRPHGDDMDPRPVSPSLPLNMAAGSLLGLAERFRQIVDELTMEIG